MTNIDEAMPYWADNGYIYFSAASEGSFQLMKCKPDGSERAQITFSSGDKFMPQLSPNGKQLLYYGNENGNMEIYVLNINSKTSTRLTNHPLLDMRPRWSPDGGKIVFERGNKGNNHHIFIMKADGKEQKQLTFEHYNYSPTFAKSTFLSVK